ncbi:hypothetical protein R3P38DRAFT_3187522 [Favolaschia claudopus]|uniref:Uncharacterized protein n=1 Tax=Favolaschia claudopus TaxID=2862362 RepID=A0AAW0C031_9AGAR
MRMLNQRVRTPIAQRVLSLAVIPVVQRVCYHKAVFRQLVQDIRELIHVVLESQTSQTTDTLRGLDRLVSLLLELNKLASESLLQSLFREIFSDVPISLKIRELQVQIRQSLEMFTAKARTQSDVQQKADKILKRMAQIESDGSRQCKDPLTSDSLCAIQRSAPATAPSDPVPLPPTYTASVNDAPGLTQIDYSDPSFDPLLLHILGISAVFHDPPSVLQISRLIAMDWKQVAATLEPVFSHFEETSTSITYSSNVKFPQSFEESILTQIDIAKYHALVAQWCLIGNTPDARDIFYACDYWDYHVCTAEPSVELFDALRNSRRPLDLTSRGKLPGLVNWLEENGAEQAADLIALYKDESNKPPQEVQIMGGMLTMVLP